MSIGSCLVLHSEVDVTEMPLRDGVEPNDEKGALRPWRIDEPLNLVAPAPRPAAFLGEGGSSTDGFGGASASDGCTDGRARTAAASAGCGGGGGGRIGGM
jgi:hypothetical protein